MESSNSMNPYPELQIVFPKSSEDSRLQLVEINGSIFAIVHAPLESQGPIRLYCEDWSLILLSPIKSKTNIVVSAINVICLNTIESEEGNVNLHASNRLVKFGQLIKPAEKVCEMGECGEFDFANDPGTLLYYNRLFDSIVGSIRSGPDFFSEAQQKFITSLATLASKIEEKSENLDLEKVFEIWSISYLKSK